MRQPASSSPWGGEASAFPRRAPEPPLFLDLWKKSRGLLAVFGVVLSISDLCLRVLTATRLSVLFLVVNVDTRLDVQAG